ncbi:unnamed protein product [Ectocarpus sp. CCAP 1310/34]|nr:unnamed protein product [Ectocarpus sp. CCAP 1310/34]
MLMVLLVLLLVTRVLVMTMLLPLLLLLPLHKSWPPVLPRCPPSLLLLATSLAMGLLSASLLLARGPPRMSMRTRAWTNMALAVTMISLVTVSCARTARPQTRGTVTLVVSPRWLWKLPRQMMRIDREFTRLEGRNHSESVAAGV